MVRQNRWIVSIPRVVVSGVRCAVFVGGSGVGPLVRLVFLVFVVFVVVDVRQPMIFVRCVRLVGVGVGLYWGLGRVDACRVWGKGELLRQKTGRKRINDIDCSRLTGCFNIGHNVVVLVVVKATQIALLSIINQIKRSILQK